MSNIKEFNDINLKVAELIEKNGFIVTAAKYDHGGYIFEFELVTGNGPFTHEAQFRLLHDPREFEFRIEKRDLSHKSEIRWEKIASMPVPDVKTPQFFSTIETLISSCLLTLNK